VEILQNCNIFNDGAWFSLTDRDARSEHVLQLEHGKPMVFGKNRDKVSAGNRTATSKSCNSATASPSLI